MPGSSKKIETNDHPEFYVYSRPVIKQITDPRLLNDVKKYLNF